jgi:hypothetical protein
VEISNEQVAQMKTSLYKAAKDWLCAFIKIFIEPFHTHNVPTFINHSHYTKHKTNTLIHTISSNSYFDILISSKNVSTTGWKTSIQSATISRRHRLSGERQQHYISNVLRCRNIGVRTSSSSWMVHWALWLLL